MNDLIDKEPVVVDIVANLEDIHAFHPKTGVDVPAYLEEAARKELQRMLNAGMLEPVQGYTQNLSRGFFDVKPTRPGEPLKSFLVAVFSGINRKLRRPEHPLEGLSGILKHGKRLDQLDERMLHVFNVCRRRGIKLSPSKLQCGRRIR